MPVEPPAAHPPGRRVKRLAFGAAVFVALAACTSSDSVGSSVDEEIAATTAEVTADSTPLFVENDSTVDTTLTSPVPETVGVQPEGFTTAIVEIIKADGTICEVCMWLADTAEERGRGLMGVTDLGTADGMVFVYQQPDNGSFFMFQTVTPLSIGWFAPDGTLVSTADMDPCASENSSQCERFPAGGGFDLAIEVFQGDLEAVGIGRGASARVIEGTEKSVCAAAG